jgi:hypothetical protein
MSPPSRIEMGERGQATPEYVGLVLLAAVALAAALGIAGVAPGPAVAEAVAAKVVCAVEARGGCGAAGTDGESPVEAAYGAGVAALIAAHSPTISFEDDDFVSLPVDPRECRERACSDSVLHGSLEHTQTGLEPTAFLHVVDCRDPAAAEREGYDCSGARAGNLYLQYWLYYPESWTRAYQRWGFHEDDWESYQVRIAPDGSALARASSHHGYNGRSGGVASIGSDLGKIPKQAWDEIAGELHVASGSHAGMTAAQEGDSRRVDPADLRLIPLESIERALGATPYAVSPPWEKAVWTDPEAMGT